MKIAVTGKMRSGKNVLANYFVKHDNAFQIAFGDGIKRLARQYFPELVVQGKPRKLYQDLGQGMRKIEPNVWVNELDRSMNHLSEIGIDSFVVSDVRQMNEYEYLKSQGFTVIKVETEDEIRKERIKQSGDVFSEKDFYHETEIAVDSIPCDYQVSNNTTLQDYYDQIEFIYNELKGEGTA